MEQCISDTGNLISDSEQKCTLSNRKDYNSPEGALGDIKPGKVLWGG